MHCLCTVCIYSVQMSCRRGDEAPPIAISDKEMRGMWPRCRDVFVWRLTCETCPSTLVSETTPRYCNEIEAGADRILGYDL